MKRCLLLVALFAVSLTARAQNARADFQLTTAVGQAVAGASVYVLQQPANTASFTPAIPVFGSSTGVGTAVCGGSGGAITNPLTTDQFGHACGYVNPGIYTICYVSSRTGTQCFQDQNFSATNGGSSFADLITSSRPVADVRAYGAVCDGATDDTVAINSAISAMHRATANCGLGSTAPTASCTGVVQITNLACAASHIVMQNNVTLQGTGWPNSVLIQLPNSNQHFITGSSPTTDQRFTVQNLLINGNASNQTGAFNCIDFNGTGALGTSTRSPRHTIMNVIAQNCLQDGIDVYGDAGSDYFFNIKGMNNGRYGMFLNVFDSQVLFSEFGQNGVAGFVTGTNGNGAIAHVKSWGNGAGSTTGVGFIIDAPNYRVENNEAQDNGCYGFEFDNTKDIVATGLFSDGNGFTGGGHSCAGFLINGLSNSKIDAIVRGVTDAGNSDFALSFQGTQTQNDIDVNWSLLTGAGFYTGSIAGNNIVAQGGRYTGQNWNNGLTVVGFTDLTQTKTLSIDNSQGNFNGNEFQASANGFKLYSLGGPNNWADFSTDTSVLFFDYGGGSYNVLEAATGTGSTGQPLVFGMQLRNSTLTVGDCMQVGASNAISNTSLPCGAVSSFTVATLPAVGTVPVGTIYRVSDASTFTVGTCTGGGGDTMLAVNNGATWTCH